MLTHRQHRRYTWLPIVVVLGLTLAACGDEDDPAVAVPIPGGTTDSGAPDDTADTTGEAFEVNAEDIAFDVDRIEVTVGQPTTVTFNNNDTDIAHNFHVRGPGIDAKTEIRSGPDTQTLELTIDQAGTYTFICDVHPEMTGELIAS